MFFFKLINLNMAKQPLSWSITLFSHVLKYIFYKLINLNKN